MCGICGLALTDSHGAIDRDALERMNTALTHRGPDDAGTWEGGHIGLAMRRLSVIDVAGSRQPMTNEDGSLALVFNGEIYNFRELRADLENRGCTFRTQGDTEVLLRAWEVYGEEAVHCLNGMFAFAVYERALDRLVLVRDRLGIKPLFYTFRNGVLAFASELGALRQSGMVPDALNAAAIDAYFTYLYIPAPDTAFEGVYKLCPGERLVFQHGTVKTERYWQPRFAPDPRWTLHSAGERYRDLLTDSVRLRTISDVPLGAFLSGGVDSSTVVGVLSELSEHPVKTFTIGFDDAQADELQFARSAAERFGTDHTERILRPDMTKVAPELIGHFGEPFADSSAVPTWFVSQTAREAVTVALSGDGGDELFAGYTWLHMNRRVAQYRRVPLLLRSLVNTAMRMAPGTPFIEKVRRFSADSLLDHRTSFRRRQTCFDADQRVALYHPDFARQVREHAVDRFAEHAEAAAGLSPDDWMLYQDTVMYLPDDVLTKVDRMSMAVGLEARVPLLDYRLVEFAATVPFSLKLRGVISKVVAKHAFRDKLPPELMHQRKRGFAIPVHRWFREDLRDVFADTVLSGDARLRRYVTEATPRRLFDTHQAGTERYGHHLWALLMFEFWLRSLDDPGV